VTSPFTPEPDVAVSENKAEISITLKAGTGYDAPWIVVKGPIDDVAVKSGLEPGSKVSDFMKVVPKMAKFFQDKAAEANPK
jgi:hypothetical protein